MDSRLPRALALFENTSPLVLKPCLTVTIDGVQHKLDSKRLIWNVLTFSPAPFILIDTILACFPHADIESNLDLTPKQWATVVTSPGQYANVERLEVWTENLLKSLLLPMRRVGTKTPSHASRDPEGTEDLEGAEVAILLNDAVTRGNQVALKKLVVKRDKAICLVTKFPIQSTAVEETGVAYSGCAHVLPFSIHKKPPVRTALEAFAPNWIQSADIIKNINHPSNAINLELGAQRAFNHLLWGIEAVPGDHGAKTRYFYRVIKQGWRYPLILLEDGDELVFGQGDPNLSQFLPNPNYCNLKLAVGRVLHACGAAEAMDYLFHEYEESRHEGARTYLDGSSNMLDLVDIILHQIAV